MDTPTSTVPLFIDTDDVIARLAETGYLADTATATAVFLADRLGKPLLVEGPAACREDRAGQGGRGRHRIGPGATAVL